MLTLYYKPTCPYCQKVFEATDELGVDFDLRDITEDESFVTELMEKGGKRQVPFLIDEEKGTSMYESDDIIAYVTEHYAGAAASKPRIHNSGATCIACEG